MNEREYLIGLNLVLSQQKSSMHRLLEALGSARAVFRQSADHLSSVKGVGAQSAQNILQLKTEKEVEKEIREAERAGVEIITLFDDPYPINLKSIFDPPPVLYIKGKILREDLISVAVVGTRTPTSYGENAARKIVGELVERGFTIISGLARGIDRLAHVTALTQKGRTLAVLGNGIRIYYPPENRKLQDKIPESGAVISQFPLSTRSEKFNFPIRNQTICGLSLGTLVVEAAEKSGALITAANSVENGREVFAVPGKIDSPKSKGTNHLIKQGAKLVESADDIVSELSEEVRQALKPKRGDQRELVLHLPKDEEQVLKVIENEEIHIDTISSLVRLPAHLVSGILVRLEIKGLIRQLVGKFFIRS